MTDRLIPYGASAVARDIDAYSPHASAASRMSAQGSLSCAYRCFARLSNRLCSLWK